VIMAAGLRATAKAMEHPPEPTVGAPVLDPTRAALADIQELFASGAARHGKADVGSRAERQCGARPADRGRPGGQ
jgi:hypothetical protein